VIEEDIEEGNDPQCRWSVSGHYHSQIFEDGEKSDNVFKGVPLVLRYDVFLKIILRIEERMQRLNKISQWMISA